MYEYFKYFYNLWLEIMFHENISKNYGQIHIKTSPKI